MCEVEQYAVSPTERVLPGPTKDLELITCAICLSEPSKERVVHSDSCTHSFCHSCLGEWYKINKTCPLCRSKLGRVSCTSEIKTRSGRKIGRRIVSTSMPHKRVIKYVSLKHAWEIRKKMNAIDLAARAQVWAMMNRDQRSMFEHPLRRIDAESRGLRCASAGVLAFANWNAKQKNIFASELFDFWVDLMVTGRSGIGSLANGTYYTLQLPEDPNKTFWFTFPTAQSLLHKDITN